MKCSIRSILVWSILLSFCPLKGVKELKLMVWLQKQLKFDKLLALFFCLVCVKHYFLNVIFENVILKIIFQVKRFSEGFFLNEYQKQEMIACFDPKLVLAQMCDWFPSCILQHLDEFQRYLILLFQNKSWFCRIAVWFRSLYGC